MLRKTSKYFREEFLLAFTRELVLNSKGVQIFRLEELLKEKELSLEIPVKEINKERKEDIREEVKEKLRPKKIDKPVSVTKDPFSKAVGKKVVPRVPMRRRPFVAPSSRMEPSMFSPSRLPSQFANVQPMATEQEIDLGKLNALIRDRNVQTVESEGPDTKVIVTGTMGKKPTSVILSKDDIAEVINKFSKESKIPALSGIFKVAVGKLMLTAMISESVGTRFVIKKISGASSPTGQIPMHRF